MQLLFTSSYLLGNNLSDVQSLKVMPSYIPSDILKKHQCNLCCYSTKNSSHFQMHKLTHSGIRPYVCQKCGKSFTQKGNLKRHYVCHFNKVL